MGHLADRYSSPGRYPGALSRAAAYPKRYQERLCVMTIHLGLTPLISLIAGILILVFPRLLNFIVGLYLIIVGLIGIFGAANYHF
jgi:hypothetical protein